MSRILTTSLQIIIGLLNAGNIFLDLFPGQEKQIFGLLMLMHIVISCIAHNYNPDGSSARVAYNPKNTIINLKDPL
jgi:hypothetical protein